jgi:hypothetical protein
MFTTKAGLGAGAGRALSTATLFRFGGMGTIEDNSSCHQSQVTTTFLVGLYDARKIFRAWNVVRSSGILCLIKQCCTKFMHTRVLRLAGLTPHPRAIDNRCATSKNSATLRTSIPRSPDRPEASLVKYVLSR